MFGEVPVFGSFSCSIDEKGRIFLPSVTRAEKGDQAVFCKSDEGDDIFDVYPLQFFTERIDFLDNIIFTSCDDERIQRAKKLKAKLCSLAMAQVNIDSQRRVFINSSVLCTLNASKLYVLGEGRTIKLFGSEKSYQEYTGHAYFKEKRR